MNKDLFQKVKELKLPIGKHALFGSAPMGIRNLRECHDADIIMTKDLWDEYRLNPDWKFGKTESGSDYLTAGFFELWHDWLPWYPEIEDLIKEAEIIDGLPFVKLETVLEWKKKFGREKDLKDVEILENFLRIKNITRKD